MPRIGWLEKKLFPTFDYTNEIQMGIVEFNDNCSGCGMCAKICLVNALEVDNKKAVMKPKADCIFCGCCEAICPKEAVVMKKTTQFKYFYKTIDRGAAKQPRVNY